MRYLSLLLVLAMSLISFSSSNAEYLGKWSEDFEDETLGDDMKGSPHNTCDPPSTEWYPMATSVGYAAYCHTAVSNLVAPRYGDKYMRTWCTVPEGDCENVWKAFKVGGVFRGYKSVGGSKSHTMAYGVDYWIGFSVWIPSDHYEEKSRQMFFQLKGSPDSGGPLWALWSFDQYNNFDTTGSTSRLLPGLTWFNLKGTWMDVVVHVNPANRYNPPDENSILAVYINGQEFEMFGPYENNLEGGAWGEGINPYFTPLQYNTAYARMKTQGGNPEDYVFQCDESIVGSPTPEFTRELSYDQFIFTEGDPGDYGYCDVCPPIWGAAPSISSPAPAQTEVGTSPTITYNGYEDHRDDLNDCFDRAATIIQIDEYDGDWSSPVYENNNAGETSQVVSNLEADVHYKLRVRHDSTRNGNPSNSEIYEGEWSEIDFYTGFNSSSNSSTCALSSNFTNATLSGGLAYYTDRDYTLTRVPAVYAGMAVITTPNDDRNLNTESDYLTFEMSAAGTVYVAYDSRATSQPEWMDGFIDTGDVLLTSLSSQPSLKIYSKAFEQGECVNFGANKAPGFTGEKVSNYIVFSVQGLENQMD